jgi:hypothetical protein
MRHQITLLGFLVGGIDISMDNEGNFLSRFKLHKRRIQTSRNNLIAPEIENSAVYTVSVCGGIALRVKQFASSGICLLIEGKLDGVSDVYADDIFFIDMPNNEDSNSIYVNAYMVGNQQLNYSNYIH